MTVEVPEAACCLSCGYRLRGLPQPVCPECGRTFDPGDVRSYDSHPKRSRRRRWIKRVVVVLLIVAVGYGLFPRSMIKSSVAFNCTVCGQGITVTRWQPVSPTWVPARYPGYTGSTQTSSPTGTGTSSPCPEHAYTVKLDIKTLSGGGFAAALPAQAGANVYINGEKLLPASAAKILENTMFNPGGIQLSFGP